MSSFSLDGRVALVTGGGRSIGAAVAQVFGEAGAKVLIANRTAAAAEAVAARIRDAGGEAQAMQCDIGLQQQARDAVEQAVDRFGALDIIVHNAGICPWMSLEQLDEATLDRTLSVNLKACFWLLQAGATHLQRSGRGRMLVTSSVTGPRVAMPDSSHYAASKAGVNGFIRSAALEYARRGITVNGVEPGYIAKDSGSLLSNPGKAARIARHIPMGKLGRAEDIAYAFCYLASDAAQYMTGQTLIVDGGSTLPESPLFLEA